MFKSERSENPYQAMIDKVLPLAMDPSDTIHLLDRGHITELAYTIVYQREVQYSIEDMYEVDAMLAMAGAFMIFFTADNDLLLKRHDETGKPPEGDPAVIKNTFITLIESTDLHTAYVDTTNFSLEDTATFVEHMILYQVALQKGGLNEPVDEVA